TGRRSGRRPAVRDAEATKQRILRASRAEFARHGYSGARVDRIARTARANKRMLYYHVGNKDALYLEALEAAYADIRAAEQELRLEAMEPLKAIERLVCFTWDYFLANPEFIALLNTENLHKARHIKRSRHIGSMNSPVVATVGRILDEGVKRRLIRAGIDPLQLYISIAALCYFYLSNLHTLTVVFDGGLKEQRALDARVAHVVDLVLSGLRRK
ncbi:MAG: TetR/AcrR family transcriptional regulator, partial [Hyphomicrobiaceae bacterium]